MSSKSSVSKANSYIEIGEFWDNHDATEFGEDKNVEFAVNIKSQGRYYPIDSLLSSKIKQLAQRRGISEETLLNLWVKEKIDQVESEQITG